MKATSLYLLLFRLKSLLNLIGIAQELDLVIIVVEKPTQIQLIAFHRLKLKGMRLLCALFLEHNFALIRIIGHQDYIILEVVECCHNVVLGRVG